MVADESFSLRDVFSVTVFPRSFCVNMPSPDLHRLDDSLVQRQVGRRWRWVISAIIVFHLAAVILPPLSFQARGELGVSPVVATVLSSVEKYGQATYIDRGYAFFAPDPGPSHLFQVAVTSKDGKRVEQMYPDLDKHWPRLMYHRHFMLSEYLEEIYQPPGPPRELIQEDRQASEYWVRARDRYVHVRQSVVDHLRKQNPGQDVAIRRIEHLVPNMTMYIDQPIALDSPDSYRVLLDQPIGSQLDASQGTLTAPSRPAEAIAVPSGNQVDSSGAESPVGKAVR